jgi:aminoglycoside phosphotransferase (APT) family kinase protein
VSGRELDLAALREALQALLPGHSLEAAEPLGRGHIHDTIAARCRVASGGVERFVVQRINHDVFRDPEALARNLARVSDHLGRALRARGVGDADRRHLRPVASPAGQTLHRARDAGWWRAFPFLEDTVAVDTPRSPDQAREAARAFGAFVADLADLDPGSLVETIPAFHDLAGRCAALERAAARDAAGRARAIAAELDEARRAAGRLLAAPELARGALPVRVVHNDCKLNNLLLDARTGEALCVIDLDTVMPGTAAFDFGELVRTAASAAAEDERDLSRVRFDLDLFRALAEGFTAGARGLLSPAEVHAFALAGPLMALENGVRFLTDHLEGDRYFRIARAGHNLDRARVQLRLVAQMLAAEVDVRSALDAVRAQAEGSSR